ESVIHRGRGGVWDPALSIDHKAVLRGARWERHGDRPQSRAIPADEGRGTGIPPVERPGQADAPDVRRVQLEANKHTLRALSHGDRQAPILGTRHYRHD